MNIKYKSRVSWQGHEGEVTLVLAHVMFNDGTHHSIPVDQLTTIGDDMQQIELDGPYSNAKKHLSDKALAYTFTFTAGFLLAYLIFTR